MAHKRKPSQSLKSGLKLAKKTVKSYSDKEKTISILLLVVFLLSGWKILSGNWEGRDIVNVVQGGHNYNEGLIGEIQHLNPVFADLNEVDRDISSLVFEGLSKFDDTGKISENIATHTLDETQTIYTFVLHDDLTWHDGELVTADDIYFTYHDIIQHPEFENPILKNSFSSVTVEKINEKTVTMTLNDPNSFFFTQLTIGLLPEHILKDVPVTDLDTHEFNQNPVGNGPYEVKSPYQVNSDGSSEVKLNYYNNYWTGASPDITEINFVAFPTYEELLEGRGRIHGAARVPKYRLEETTEERFAAYEYQLPQYTALFMETDDDRLLKRNLRLAIQKSINKQEILEAVGYDHLIDTPLLELDQEDWIYQANSEEAMGALYDEGWFLDEETGLRMNDEDEVLSLSLVRQSFTNNEKQEEVTDLTAKAIASQLSNVGIVVTIETYENEAFQQKVSERDYDLLLLGQSLGYNLDTYSYWHSSQAGTGLNFSNYGNNKADFFIEAIRNSFGDEEDEKEEYLQSLAETIKEDVPAVFLYTPTYYFLADSRIENINTSNLLFPHDRFANILDWKVTK
jgi:peptide/nickel transport system substrate-binding protein